MIFCRAKWYSPRVFFIRLAGIPDFRGKCHMKNSSLNRIYETENDFLVFYLLGVIKVHKVEILRLSLFIYIHAPWSSFVARWKPFIQYDYMKVSPKTIDSIFCLSQQIGVWTLKERGVRITRPTTTRIQPTKGHMAIVKLFEAGYMKYLISQVGSASY